MSSLLFFSCEDPSALLGRLDYTLFTQQTLMEITVGSLATWKAYRDEAGNFLPIEDWHDIALNVKGEVRAITFEDIGEGTFVFESIPQTTQKVFIVDSRCAHEVPWKKIPSELRYFVLHSGLFHGTVNFSVIPRGLYVFSLTEFDLGDNAFTGPIDISFITRSICEDDFAHFELQYSNADPPAGMDFGIDLSRNQFEGDVVVKDLTKVTDEGQFRENKSRFMIDKKGDRRPIEQAIAQNDFEWQ